MSRFLNDAYEPEADSGIDFDRTTPLPGGGSTCLIYRTKWQRRTVFVKRLKPELRDKPIYLDALDKEFEIGVGLKHPSLPAYLEAHRDYLVIEYVDGKTLASMLAAGDAWLDDEQHVVRLLRQLVEAVDYLHSHNVIHGDIKPDNVIITAVGKNVMLVDFDKSYTDSLSDTPGDPRRYGLAVGDVGSASVDFRGIARVAEALTRRAPILRLRLYKGFIKACQSENAESSRLLKMLDYKPWRRFAIVVSAVVVTTVAAIILLTPGVKSPNSVASVPAVIAAVDTIRDLKPQPPGCSTDVYENRKSDEVSTSENLQYDAQQKAAILDKKIYDSFQALHSDLDHLQSIQVDLSFTSQQMLDSIRANATREDKCISDAFVVLAETFPDITDSEVWRIMGSSKVYTGYKRRATQVQAAFAHEYERRLSQEKGSEDKD